MITVMVSGGFDPLHPGHLALLENAARLGSLTVVINSDEWLKRKKGFVFQPWEARAQIIGALRYVYAVEPVDDSDGTVCDAIKRLHPTVFCNGGDRSHNNTPEVELCQRLGIATAFGVGGGKLDSSSEIAKRDKVQRKWGSYEVLFDSPWCKVKRLVLNPHTRHTAQRHFKREEYWFYDGGMRYIPRKDWHQLDNPSNEPLEIIEVQVGECREDDIERRENKV
jgi:D-beta-D-heptose 7-phosphate kinase/D-beta-D-heptose 1-phosphate adenosyltransferase